MTDERSTDSPRNAPRAAYELDDRGFDEVPRRYRKYYRRWLGEVGDALAPNEVLCPVCRVVVRSAQELREGDRIYCMACMSRMRVASAPSGGHAGVVEY